MELTWHGEHNFKVKGKYNFYPYTISKGRYYFSPNVFRPWCYASSIINTLQYIATTASKPQDEVPSREKYNIYQYLHLYCVVS